MFEWFAESGYQANFAELSTRFPFLATFEDFLRDRLANRRTPDRDRVGDN
ncbi:hypothetical protein [Amycolatopsis sp. cmx-4-54]